MTDLLHDDAPPAEWEPGDELDRQAAAEGYGRRPKQQRNRTPAHDLDAERAVIGVMCWAGIGACDAVTETGLQPEHFYTPRYGHYYAAILAALANNDIPDPITVRAHCDDPTTAGHDLTSMAAETPMARNAWSYARRVLTCAHARQLQGRAIEIADAAQLGNLEQALQLLTEAAQAAPTPIDQGIRHAPLGTFVDTDEPAHDWIIPDLLERTDRILLTGPEGGGKSTLLRQIAVQAASGIHPFTLNEIEPLRVLLLDLENSERHLRRALHSLRAKVGVQADANLVVASHPQGLDLTAQSDVTAFRKLLAETQPDLVIGGPVYKLVGGDPNEEQPAKAAAMILDDLRTSHGFALALETHQPHGTGSERPERPYGASLWKRWPEFGLHISEAGLLRHWRGARDERSWPGALQRGGDWPWTMVVDSKMLTFARICELTREHGRRLSQRELSVMTGAPKTNVARALEANKKHYDELCASLGGEDEP